MDDKLRARLELFTANTQSIKQEFKWYSTQANRLAAMLYTTENRTVDCDSIRECHELIKSNTGLFSTFRGTMVICVAALLSLSADRQQRFTDTLTAYKMMKDEKFWSSDYLVLAAYQVAAGVQPEEFSRVIGRAKAFYDGMKKNHWFNTGHDDYIFSAMLGLSDMDVAEGVERMERLHGELKLGSVSGNSVQAMTQVLVLGGESSETVSRVLALRDVLKERKLRLDKEYTYSSLGVLALLPDSVISIADNISESFQFLRAQKGLGSWSIEKYELLLFSAAIVALNSIEDAKCGVLTATFPTILTNIILAQQAAAMAMIAASSAAVAASSSS